MLGCLKRAALVVPDVVDCVVVVVDLDNRGGFGSKGRTDLLLRHPCHSSVE